MERRELLQCALDGIHHKRGELADLAREITHELMGTQPPAKETIEGPPRRKRSAATRKKMAAAQRARWKKAKQAQG